MLLFKYQDIAFSIDLYELNNYEFNNWCSLKLRLDFYICALSLTASYIRAMCNLRDGLADSVFKRF